MGFFVIVNATVRNVKDSEDICWLVALWFGTTATPVDGWLGLVDDAFSEVWWPLCGVWLGGLAQEGSEVATRGRAAADFKPSPSPFSTLTRFHLKTKKVEVQMRLISTNQTFLNPGPWKDVILNLSKACSDDQLCSVANFGHHFNIQLLALTNYWLQNLIQLTTRSKQFLN